MTERGLRIKSDTMTTKKMKTDMNIRIYARHVKLKVDVHIALFERMFAPF